MGIDLGRFKSKSSEEWDDWLSDDPVPATFRDRMRLTARRERPQSAVQPTVRRAGQQPITRPQVASSPGPARRSQPVAPSVNDKKAQQNPSVSIHISFPKFKKPALPKKLEEMQLPKLPKNLTYKRLGIVSGALAVVLVVGIIALGAKNDKQKPGSTEVLGSNSRNVNFAYNLPTGAGHEIKPEEVRYDSSRKVVNYKDSIGGVEITVSQQPLPDDFDKDTTEKVKKLAEGFSATKTVATANPTAYIGTSVKGPQTVIFSKKDLLVFIQSTKEIDDHDWAEYITNLK